MHRRSKNRDLHQIPKSTYNIEFPLNSNCSLNYCIGSFPRGVRPDHRRTGSTVNFSDSAWTSIFPTSIALRSRTSRSMPDLQIATSPPSSPLAETAIPGIPTTCTSLGAHSPAAKDPGGHQCLGQLHNHYDTRTRIMLPTAALSRWKRRCTTCEETRRAEDFRLHRKGITSYGVVQGRAIGPPAHYTTLRLLTLPAMTLRLTDQPSKPDWFRFRLRPRPGFRVAHSFLRAWRASISSGGKLP